MHLFEMVKTSIILQKIFVVSLNDDQHAELAQKTQGHPTRANDAKHTKKTRLTAFKGTAA